MTAAVQLFAPVSVIAPDTALRHRSGFHRDPRMVEAGTQRPALASLKALELSIDDFGDRRGRRGLVPTCQSQEAQVPTGDNGFTLPGRSDRPT
jgi:hypothetical protein